MLALLRDDARATLASLARAVNLGQATVHERVRRLERDGLLKGYHARLDYARLDLGLSAFIGLQMQQSAPARARLSENLRRMPEVEELAWLTGDFDALVRIRARDTVHLQQVVFRLIQAGDGQMRTRTMVILSEPFAKPGPEFEAITLTDMQGSDAASTQS